MTLDELTTDGLRSYIGTSQVQTDDALLAPALDGTRAFVARNYPAAAVAPVGADVVDAVYTLAARRFYERNVGYVDVIDDGAGGTWVKAMPSSVRLVLSAYETPRAYVG